MANYTEITVPATFIEVFDNFVSTDVNCRFRATATYTNPLTTASGGAGWFCYIQNMDSGGPVSISAVDGTEFLVNGTLIATLGLPAYTTARFTLTYWTALGQYYWSVLR